MENMAGQIHLTHPANQTKAGGVMATKHQAACDIAVEKCRNMYDADNQMMRSVAAIIAMDAIDCYTREMSKLKKEKVKP
jgi:hypothetical protein